MALGCGQEPPLAGVPQQLPSSADLQSSDDAALQGAAAARPASCNNSSDNKSNKRDAVLAGCIEPCLLIAADAASADGALSNANSSASAQRLAAEAISTLSSCVQVNLAGYISAGFTLWCWRWNRDAAQPTIGINGGGCGPIARSGS